MRRAVESADEVLEGLDAKRRILLFYKTPITASEALLIKEEAIDLEMIQKCGVSSFGIIASGLGITGLHRLGVGEPGGLKRYGIDALHLVDRKFCLQAREAYGADAVKSAFLVSASDAVSLAGSEATELLSISNQDLLRQCAAAHIEAEAVLQQQGSNGLDGVAPKTLLDTGLRSGTLSKLGFVRDAL